jgi:beta-glucanase (GH16 family)
MRILKKTDILNLNGEFVTNRKFNRSLATAFSFFGFRGLLFAYQNCDSGGLKVSDKFLGSSGGFASSIGSATNPPSSPGANPPSSSAATQCPAVTAAFPITGSTATASAPVRAGFTAQIIDNFKSLDLSKWQALGAGSPWQGLGLGTWNQKNVYLPNQWVLIPGGGVRLVATQQSWNAIGGINDVDCLGGGGSNCQFSWTGPILTGKSGLESGYGYYEWAVKLPAAAVGSGTWPATWLMGGEGSTQYEEIDFMERFEGDPQNVHFTYHYGSKVGDYQNSNQIPFCTMADPLNNEWADLHTFAVDWEPGSITGYIDGKACGSVTSGQVPQYAWQGTAPAILPNGLMYPLVNIAIPGDANLPAGTVANMDVMHYYYYSNNALPAVPSAPLHLSNIQVDKCYYNPGDTVTVTYSVSAGAQSQSQVTLSSIGVYDYFGDKATPGSPGQGSKENNLFAGAMAGTGLTMAQDGTATIALPNTIAANSTYTGTFTYQIPANMVYGVYVVWLPYLSGNGGGDQWENYAQIVVGANTLPPTPIYH